MKISAILCTHNRCVGLAKALGSLALSRLPEAVAWEVLVVDNNSTDGTREVVEDFRRRYPSHFRYAFEPRPGKSFALNTGVRQAQGDVLVFIDDDVIVDPAWLRSLTAPLEDGKWSGVGGRTLWEGTFDPPVWMTTAGPNSMEGALGPRFDLGLQPCTLDSPPYGANMAFRKEMFDKYGLFRTDLGPSPDPDVPRPNEDTEFGRRLMNRGEKLRYEPSAIVYHPILENRLKKEYFLAWHFDCGRALVREWKCGPDIFGISRRYFALCKFIGAYLPMRILNWTLTLNPQQKFSHKCSLWVTAGQITEIYRQARGSRGQPHQLALETDTARSEEGGLPVNLPSGSGKARIEK